MRKGEEEIGTEEANQKEIGAERAATTPIPVAVVGTDARFMKSSFIGVGGSALVKVLITPLLVAGTHDKSPLKSS